jgi:hypothetical protein
VPDAVDRTIAKSLREFATRQTNATLACVGHIDRRIEAARAAKSNNVDYSTSQAAISTALAKNADHVT